MLTAPTSLTLLVVGNEDVENIVAQVSVELVVSTQHLGARVSHPFDNNIL